MGVLYKYKVQLAVSYPWWSLILRSILLNVFINSLGDGIESTLSKFADATKLGKVVDTLEGKASIQRDFGRLTGTSWHSAKANASPAPGREWPCVTGQPGQWLARQKHCRKDLGGSGRQRVEHKLATCPYSKEGRQPTELYEQMWSQKIRGCDFPPTHTFKHLWGCTWYTMSSLGYPVQGRHWNTRASTAGGYQDDQGGWNASHIKKCSFSV